MGTSVQTQSGAKQYWLTPQYLPNYKENQEIHVELHMRT
jgi:hypothetical protein